jgi:hypothetical protein
MIWVLASLGVGVLGALAVWIIVEICDAPELDENERPVKK